MEGFSQRVKVHFGFETWLLLLVAWALPRTELPTAPALVCAALAWLAFSASLLPPALLGRAQRLCQVVAGAALAALAVLAPPTWLALGACLTLLAFVTARSTFVSRCSLALGLGVLAPLVLYGVVFAAGPDERVALRLAFRMSSSAAELVACALVLALGGALTLVFLSRHEPAIARLLEPLTWVLAGLLSVVLAARLVCVVSELTLPGDLSIWSEAPALTNLLKLHNGAIFYGPLERVDSYSYSPGLEFTQYTLLRPFGLELSLRAHRLLGLFWQAASAWLLSRALWPWLGERLSGGRPGLGRSLLWMALANITFSSLLAPHVHPDHLLMLCFCAALAVGLRPSVFERRTWPALVLLPLSATVFKLTGAGVGVGLVLVALFERRFRALWALGIGGLLALATIPLFDAELGQFTLYAIRVQASHPVLWARLQTVPGTPMGMIFLVACSGVLTAHFTGVATASVRAASRCLLLTAGLALPSLVAYCKLGGRDNSLLPLAIGGSVALLVLLGEAPRAPRAPVTLAPPVTAVAEVALVGARSNALLVLVMLWLGLTTSWPIEPALGASRALRVAVYEREVNWLRDMFAHGRHPLAQGTAAWIDAGRRDVPRDRLSSASELYLGHWPDACETRLLDGTYDGLFLGAAALNNNPLLVRLRPSLERLYRVTEPLGLRNEWPADNDGFVILERR